jgi:hypothetical protein
MSRGLGKLQRSILEMSSATKTWWSCDNGGLYWEAIWDRAPEHADVQSWTGRNGQSYWGKQFRDLTEQQYRELLKECEQIYPRWDGDKSPDISSIPELLGCLICKDDLLVKLYGDLFTKNHLEYSQVQYEMIAYSKFGCATPIKATRWAERLPVEIKRKKASAEASFSRAMASMYRQGLVSYGLSVGRAKDADNSNNPDWKLKTSRCSASQCWFHVYLRMA